MQQKPPLLPLKSLTIRTAQRPYPKGFLRCFSCLIFLTINGKKLLGICTAFAPLHPAAAPIFKTSIKSRASIRLHYSSRQPLQHPEGLTE